jgi:hypothetical protein
VVRTVTIWHTPLRGRNVFDPGRIGIGWRWEKVTVVMAAVANVPKMTEERMIQLFGAERSAKVYGPGWRVRLFDLYDAAALRRMATETTAEATAAACAELAGGITLDRVAELPDIESKVLAARERKRQKSRLAMRELRAERKART